MASDQEDNHTQQYDADAYDVRCRVCGWETENVSPNIAMMQMLTHSDHHSGLGEPMFALRVVEGFQGTDPENPHLTPEDGWNRSPTLNHA